MVGYEDCWALLDCIVRFAARFLQPVYSYPFDYSFFIEARSMMPKRKGSPNLTVYSANELAVPNYKFPSSRQEPSLAVFSSCRPKQKI